MKRSAIIGLAVLAVVAAAAVFLLARTLLIRPPAAALPSPAALAATAVAPRATPAPAVTRVRVTPTPDPARPAGLTAQIDPALDLDHYGGDVPLTVFFDRPVNMALTSRPLVFDPNVAGRFGWNKEATALTFFPDARFVGGRTYTVTLAERLRARDGSPVAEPRPAWTLHVARPPSVSRRAPNAGKGSDRQPAFRLTFNHPMDGDSVLAAFGVQPQVAVDVAWEDGELLIRPAAPLDPGVTYLFNLDPSAADATGITMAKGYSFTYTPNPLIAGVSGPRPADPDVPLTLTFGYPLNRSAGDLLVIDPPLEGRWQWQSDTVVALMDASPLGNVSYGFSFSADPLAATGETMARPAKPVFYKTPSPVLAVSPAGRNVPVGVALRLVFDRPMDPDTTAAALTLDPPAEGEVTWDENTLIFRPEGGWETRTAYSVTLQPTAADADGHPVLGQAFVATFKTGWESSLAGFGMGLLTQIVDADGRRAIQFQVNDDLPATLDFELLPIDETGLLNRLSAGVSSGWGETAHISDDGLSPLLAWTATTARRTGDDPARGQETFLPAEAPIGLYVLRLTDEVSASHLLVTVSRLTLLAKRTVDELVVFVSDAPTLGRAAQPDGAAEGAPTPGAAVRVYAENGALLAEGQTDERGLARLTLPAGAAPFVAIAQLGDDLTFSGLTGELQGRGGAWGWDGEGQPLSAPLPFTAHVQTDRPIYRPGQTVYYKAILRLEDDGAVILPPEGTQAIVRLRDPRGNLVRTKWLATDAFGAVYDSFDLAEGAMLGAYSVLVSGVADSGAVDIRAQTFQVEEYRKPDFAVTVTAAPEVIAGETLTVTVRAEYLFGQPVAGAKVAIRLYETAGRYDYGYGEDWEPSSDYWIGGYEPIATGVTDANGEVSFTTTSEKRAYWYYDIDPWRVAIEATVDDGSAQTVSAMATSTVYQAAEVVRLDTGGYWVNANEPFAIEAKVVSNVGQPQPVAGRTVEVTLRQWDRSVWEYSHVVQTDHWTSGPDGVLATSYRVPRPGYYRLRLTGADDAGRQLFVERYFYATGAGDADLFEGGNVAEVTLLADRDSYAPGDTARLAVRTPFAGPALLTFERAAVRREMAIALTPPVTFVDVPILAEDAPNIYVTLNAWEPLDATPQAIAERNHGQTMSESSPDARLRVASVNLIVPVTDKTLTVTITPDRERYAARDTAEVVVRVTDAAGQPVAAQVALSLVDEAIFLLREDDTPGLHDTFYHLRGNYVRTYNALSPWRMFYSDGMGGGGGGDMPNAPRADFPDTAAWFPALLTDANGEARVTLRLPDSLTTWRLTGRAVSATTQVGEARATFITQQPVIVRPILPRALTAGDRLALSAIVHNLGDTPVELAVSLSEDGGLLRVDGPAQTITLDPGQTRVVGWPVEVLAAGEGRALVVATPTGGAGAGDAIELPLLARPLAIPVVEAQAGDTDGGGRLTFSVPANALPDYSTVTLDVSRSAAGSLPNGLEYLTGFPYGCVEQTMSRALPNTVVGRAFDALGLEPPGEVNIDRLVNASAQRLYGFQHDDGGWGWWFDDDSTPYQTAWVVFGLATMAEAGHEIDPDVIARGMEYLNEELIKADDRTQALMLYSLAAAGQPNGPAALELAAAPGKLDAFSLAALALALDAAGESAAATAIMDQLAATAIVAGGQAHWGLRDDDGQYDRKTMASATRSTALALSAFLKLRPGDPLEPQIVRWLMAQRRGYGWGTTNETAYAILALTDHLLASGVNDSAVAWSLTLDGAPAETGALAPGELHTLLSLPVAELAPGEHTLALSGDARLYYALQAHYAVGQAEVAADGPLLVTRQFLTVDNKPLGEVHVGDLVRVRIRVHVPRPTYFVLVEDRPVAGLEPLNERLNTTSRVAIYYEDDRYGSHWRVWDYNYKEIRDDRVTFFISQLGGGEVAFDYLARATHSGTYTALPVEASAMYDPAAWGRSGSAVLVVGR